MLRSSRAHYTLIVVLWGLTMLAGLGGTALWEPDEPRFAEATRQMFERGDFLTPWFNGRPRFEKPILLYWLQAPFVALMGPVETAFRLPAALAGLLTLIVVYRLGGRLASPFAGLLGALSLATMFRFILYARQSLTDVPVTALVTVAVWAFLLAHGAPSGRSRRLALMAWAATGLAALTKGPVAVLGPAIWVGFGVVAHRRTFLPRMHVLSGLTLATAIALPWHIVMLLMHGRAFLDVYLGYEVLARYMSDDFPGRDRGVLYFAGVWLGDAAPWSLFFLGGVAWAVAQRDRLDAGVRRLALLAGIWFFVVMALFSVSEYKLPHYIMPAYPPTALLVGAFLDAAIRGAVDRRALWIVPAVLSGVLLAAGAVLLALLLVRAFALDLTDPAISLPLVMLAGAIAVCSGGIRRDAGRTSVALLATLAVAYGLIVALVAPRELRGFQPIPELGAALQRVAKAGDPVAVAGNYGAPGLVFYGRTPVNQLAGREALLEFLSAPGPRHCVLPQADFDAIAGQVPRPWRVVAQGDVFSVRMRRLLERSPERAGRTLLLVTVE